MRILKLALPLLVLGLVSAEAQPQGGQKWAILIGVGDYEDGNINDLPYAPEDAKQIYSLLKERGEFYEEHLLLMVDDSPPDSLPTRSNILLKLATWLQPVRKGDTVLFYFSGHGVADAERGYLVPIGARMAVIREESIGLDTVMEYLRDSGAGKVLVLLDACHSGMAKVGAPTEAMGEGFEKSIVLEPRPEYEAEGEVVLASCQPEQYSYPYDPGAAFSVQNRSLFTHFVLQGLGGTADKAPRDRVVTVSELNEFVYQGVTTRAAEIGVVQKPMIKISGTGAITEVPLLAVPPVGVIVANAFPWAKVFLDGVEVGETPLTIQDVAAGEHTIRLEYDNQTYQDEVMVKERETTRFSHSF